MVRVTPGTVELEVSRRLAIEGVNHVVLEVRRVELDLSEVPPVRVTKEKGIARGPTNPERGQQAPVGGSCQTENSDSLSLQLHPVELELDHARQRLGLVEQGLVAIPLVLRLEKFLGSFLLVQQGTFGRLESQHGGRSQRRGQQAQEVDHQRQADRSHAT